MACEKAEHTDGETRVAVVVSEASAHPAAPLAARHLITIGAMAYGYGRAGGGALLRRRANMREFTGAPEMTASVTFAACGGGTWGAGTTDVA